MFDNNKDKQSTNSTNSTNSATSKQNSELNFDIASAPKIPDTVYNDLPIFLAEPCKLIDSQHQRDMFLTSSLPVIASHMPNVHIVHKDGIYSPDLFVIIIAAPATGKGIISKSKKLGRVLQNKIEENSIYELQAFENLSEAEKKKKPKPQQKTLYIPANSSSRAFLNTLKANGGSGLLFETEIDTLLNADRQDWGNFTDIIRKAFHHEHISISRKDEYFHVERPNLSICMSGTFDQFANMFNNAANGHYSRYAFYTHTGTPIWQSHRPTKESKELDNYLDEASEQLFHIYERLSKRDKPLKILLTEEQWDLIDEHFSNWMALIEELDIHSYFHATNNRMPIIMLRITAIFAILRSINKDSKSIDHEILRPIDNDINAALTIAEIYLRHSLRLFCTIQTQMNSSTKGERFNNFYSKLPDIFETKDAIAIAEILEIPISTVKKWLPKHFDKVEHGVYRKKTI